MFWQPTLTTIYFYVSLLIPLLEHTTAMRGHQVVRGEVAERGQFPFYVQLFVPNSFPVTEETHGVSCSGTLLHKRWILTAAHCFRDTSIEKLVKEDKELVYMGHIKNLDPAAYKNALKKVFLHAEYYCCVNTSGFEMVQNNIALGKLKRLYSINDFVQTVTLPFQVHHHKLKRCRVGAIMGIAQTGLFKPTNDYLRYALVNSTSGSKDMQKLFSHAQFFSKRLPDKVHDLARNPGSPFVCYPRNSVIGVQFGVISVIVQTKSRGTVGIYENVEMFTEFINQHVPHVREEKSLRVGKLRMQYSCSINYLGNFHILNLLLVVLFVVWK